MNNDGTGEIVIANLAGWFLNVQEGYDGKRGVAVAEDTNGYYQVFYSGDLTNQNQAGTALTTDNEDHWSAQLSWDGKKAVLVKYDTNAEQGQAVIMSTSGGAETMISTPFYVSTPSFTPDGKIVFEQEDDDTINIMNVDGTGNKALTGDATHTYFDEYPSVSADGKTIAFARYPADESSGENIWTIGIDGTGAKQLTTDGMSWDPMFVNGKIVFVSYRDNAAGNEIYSMNPDGTNQKRLTNNNVNDVFDDW